MDNRLRCLKGKVYGYWLVTGVCTRYKLKTNIYNGKEGFFNVRDGLVYGFVPYPHVFLAFPDD